MSIVSKYLRWKIIIVFAVITASAGYSQSLKIDTLLQTTTQNFSSIQFTPPNGLNQYKTIKYIAYTLYQKAEKADAKRFLESILEVVVTDELSIAEIYEILELRLSFGFSDSLDIEAFYTPLKLKLYNEFLAQQKLSLLVGKSYAAQGRYTEAVQIFRDIFAMRTTKFRVSGEEYQFKYSVPLFRLQGEAFLEMIVIADRTKDTFLLQLLKHPEYRTVASNYKEGLGKKILNSVLLEYGIEPVED